LRPGQTAHILYGPEQAQANWPAASRTSPPGPHPHGPLSCAIVLGMARGLPVQEAVDQALRSAAALGERWFQPGMGHKILLRATP
jgi:hydroxymethylpyrimidine/phosphomethylpyrimidine kinase